jgi:DNA repair exonuclease SbcCD ATPase subunit
MSQDIEIDPDSRTIKYYEKPTEQSIREHIDAGGTLLNNEQARVLLDEIDRLRKDCEHHKQAALDISDENDQLRKLVPPEPERGPGFVGQGSWSVYAEKVVAERDEARDDLNTLCEDIRVLKEEYDDFKSEADERIQALIKDNRAFADDNAALADDNRCLHEKVKRLEERLAAKKEHANCHYGDKFEFNGIDGYGNFSLRRVDKDRWEIQMLHEKVTLYNRKGHRVRGDHNYDGDW